MPFICMYIPSWFTSDKVGFFLTFFRKLSLWTKARLLWCLCLLITFALGAQAGRLFFNPLENNIKKHKLGATIIAAWVVQSNACMSNWIITIDSTDMGCFCRFAPLIKPGNYKDVLSCLSIHCPATWTRFWVLTMYWQYIHTFLQQYEGFWLDINIYHGPPNLPSAKLPPPEIRTY